MQSESKLLESNLLESKSLESVLLVSESLESKLLDLLEMLLKSQCIGIKKSNKFSQKLKWYLSNAWQPCPVLLSAATSTPSSASAMPTTSQL
jgi:hypothetical protein